MFRTRDFILLFTTIVFLVSAIGVTVLFQDTASSGGAAVSNAVLQQRLEAGADQDYQVVIATREGLSRSDRVQQMREKIAQTAELSAPEPDLPEVIDSDLATTTEEGLAAVTGLDQCRVYAPYLGFWDARNLSVVASEGATLVVRVNQLPSGSSTETTMLQLPRRSAAAPDQSCISSDVIGIANDGSLIRNDELDLYSVFSSETRIGYALDGFPIYGTGSAMVDQCGGRLVNGQYRYELQVEQDTIINCFSAAPIMLP
jgi:hypothetical protein